MTIMLAAGGAALFLAGSGLGIFVTLAAAKRKITAVTEAAEAANARIAAESEQAIRDLGDAHARADSMLSAIETAKASTARAEASVAGLIAKITVSREELDRASRLSWFERSEAADAARTLRRAAKAERDERTLLPPVEA